MKILRLKTLAILLVSAMIGGCIPQFGDPAEFEWNPDFALSLVNTSLNIQDLLDEVSDDDLLQTDPQGLLTIVYNGDKITAQNINPLDINSLAFPILTPNQQAPTNFLSPRRLDILEFNSGYVKYSAQSPLLEDVNVTLTLTDLQLGGTAFVTTFTIPAATVPTNPSEYTDSMNIPGYILNMEDGDFETQYTATTAVTGQNVTIPMLVEMKDLGYEYIQGYFGIDTIRLDSGRYSLGFFDNLDVNGNIFFAEPSLTFRVENQIGFPTKLQSDSIGFETKQGGLIYLQNSDINNGFDITSPTLAQAGQFASSTLTLDANNSNIENIVSSLPYTVDYRLQGILNPADDGSVTNFYDKDYVLDFYLDVEVPLFGTASGFFTRDTFDVNLQDLSDIERLSFKIVADNGLPLDVGMQGYFMDAAGGIVDSLFVGDFPTVIAAAAVDADGVVTQSQETITQSNITEAQITELRNRAINLILVSKIDTKDGGATNVKILSTYQLDLRVGIVIGL